MTLIATSGQDLPAVDPSGLARIEGAGAVLSGQRIELVVVVGVAGLAAMAVGLLISAIVRSSDRAMALLPVVLIAQVVVSVPFFATRSAVLDPVGVVSSAQWAMAASASTTDLNDVRSVDLAVTGAGRSALVDRELPANSRRAVASAAAGRERWDHTGGVWLRDMGAALLLTGRCADTGRDRPAAPGPCTLGRAGEGVVHVTRQIGRYEIDREIGRGGTAIVYLARQVDLGREVALKELSAFHAGDRLFAERFLREARLGGSLNHPNIVTVYDYFEHDAVPYIAMEYVARGSLRAYDAPLSMAQSLGVLEGMLAGLSHAEARSIVHRDLKPENLMVADDGTIKIADFGIAKALSGSVSINLTETGTTVGTPHYMAPEQAMGEPIGPATDLYATGAIAYELFTGRPPFGSAATPMAVLLRHVSEQAEPPIAHDPALDPRISEWIMRTLAKRPEDRPASAEVAWEELEDIALDLLGPRWRRNARLLGDAAGKGSASPTASVVPVPVAPTITAQNAPDADLQHAAEHTTGATVAAQPSAGRAPRPPSLARGRCGARAAGHRRGGRVPGSRA